MDPKEVIAKYFPQAKIVECTESRVEARLGGKHAVESIVMEMRSRIDRGKTVVRWSCSVASKKISDIQFHTKGKPRVSPEVSLISALSDLEKKIWAYEHDVSIVRTGISKITYWPKFRLNLG